MYYYKKTKENGELEFLQSCNLDLSKNSDLTEISKDEYDEITEKLIIKAAEEEVAFEQEQADYVTELEKENAALLYQVLTGEVLDV